MRKESRKRVLLDRLDFTTQLGERFPPDLAKDFRVTPFAMQASRAEATLKHPALMREEPQRIFDNCRVERKTIGDVPFRERAVRAGVAAHKLKNGLRHRRHQRSRKSWWERNPECIAITRSIFSGNQAALTGDAQFEEPARTDKPVNRFKQGWVGYAKRKLSTR
jgi:hypothetical protein